MPNKFLRHAPCPHCGSKDNVLVYDDEGPFKCAGCEELVSKEQLEDEGANNKKCEEDNTTKLMTQETIEQIQQYNTRALQDRGISQEVMEHFGVKVETAQDGGISAHFYPYGTEPNKVSGYKKRTLPKSFYTVGSIDGLFGQTAKFKSGKDSRLVITEGELDALSVAEAYKQKYNNIYPVAALPSSAATAELINNREWIRKFDEVVLLLDNDDAGQKCLSKACSIIGADKVKIGRLNHKDPNEELLKKGFQSIIDAIWDAEAWNPAGILSGPKLWEEFTSLEVAETVPYPPCMQGINELAKGMRVSEVDVFTSGTGIGKSSVIKEIILHVLETTPDSVGLISLEESPGETVEKLIGMKLGANMFHVGDSIPDKEKKAAFNSIFSDDRLKILDHQGSISDDSLMEKIETLCLMGCKYLILDHLTMAISEIEGKSSNAAADKAMSDIVKLAKRHKVWFGVISHVRKTDTNSKSFEEGRMPGLDDPKGSGAIKQVANKVIAFTRHLSHEDHEQRNTLYFSLLKSRRGGDTGNAKAAAYDHETTRLSFIDTDQPPTSDLLFDDKSSGNTNDKK